MKDQPTGQENPLISVVIPVYNVKKYIKRCVDGVLAQTYKNLEVILVDDGSTDGSSKICDDYFQKDKRVVVFHKPNGGLSSARNYGVRSANGEYITFVDSDDSVDEDYVETLYNIIVKYKVDLAICSHRVIYEGRTPIDMGTGESGAIESKLVLRRILYSDGIDISSWGKLFKREILIPHPFPEGRNFEDAATTYLYVDSVNKVGLNSVAKYSYYIRKKSISNANFTKMKMDLITSTTEMHDYICEKYPRMKAAAERRLMYAYLSTLRQIALSPVSADSEEYLPVVWQYIKSHRSAILKDPKIPARDRHALNATKLGYGYFRMELKMYEKMRHLLT